MGWIKTEHRTEHTLTCWHVLLSAFQGGFSLFALLWRDIRDTITKWGWLFLRWWVNFTPAVWVRAHQREWHQLHSQGEWGCCGSWGGSGVSESSVLNQTNTLEFLPLLVQRVEWQGCIAELPVSRDDSGSKCDHPWWHCLIWRLSHVACFKINLYTSMAMHINTHGPRFSGYQ